MAPLAMRGRARSAAWPCGRGWASSGAGLRSGRCVRACRLSRRAAPVGWRR